MRDESVVAFGKVETFDIFNPGKLAPTLPERLLDRRFLLGEPVIVRDTVQQVYDGLARWERDTERQSLTIFVPSRLEPGTQVALNGVVVNGDPTGMTPREFLENVLARRREN